jgi:hypothetical protein
MARKNGFRHKKRTRESEHTTLSSNLANISARLERHEQALYPVAGAGCFNMMTPGTEDLDELIDYCWSADYSGCCSDTLDANMELHELLGAKTKNTYIAEDLVKFTMMKELQLTNLIGYLMRIQNQCFMPKLIVIRTVVQGEKRKMCVQTWDDRSVNKEMVSRTWMKGTFLPRAVKRDPGSKYPLIPLIGAAALDNFTLQCNYHGVQRLESDGWRLDMTNWATIGIPKAILTPNELGSCFGKI